MDRSIVPATSSFAVSILPLTRNGPTQVNGNKLTAPIIASMLMGVRDYFKRKNVIGSRYWDFHPFKTLMFKTKVFCDSLSCLDSEDVFRQLFAYYFSNILPITMIDRISQQFLPVKTVRNSPSLEEMIINYLSKLYEDRLAKIRAEVHQFDGDIYLAFTTEELELGNLTTLRKRTSKNEIQFGYFLFIIVGFIEPKSLNLKPPKKYLLKAVRLLQHQGDTISDDLFEEIFMNTLKQLWPKGDHLSRASAQLKHIVADGGLLFEDLFRNLRNRYSELSRLVLAQNTHMLMHSIESDIRRNFNLSCKVIDVVRMQWAISENFRDKYKRLSSETATPPESFYRSASFYSANFSEAQRGILCWRSFRFDATAVSSTLSNPESRPEFDKLSESSSALLEAIERASTIDVHFFSIQVADLFHELLQYFTELLYKDDGDIYQQYVDWYVETIQKEIGGSEAEKIILTSGEYQLLKRLFVKLFSRSMQTASFSKYRFTKYFIIKCVHTGAFRIPTTFEDIKLPIEPLVSSQLRRSFPRFWFLFKKYEVPLPWSVMNECSLVYAWAEANEHWSNESELEKNIL